MKITLEFEDADLREMLTEYFKAQGFTVKNLDTIVDSFKEAFPSGIAVHAEMAPLPEPTPPGMSKSLVGIPENPVPIQITIPAAVDPGYVTTNSDDAEDVLNLNDLLDPTPRRGAAEASEDVQDILKLVRTSNNIARSKER